MLRLLSSGCLVALLAVPGSAQELISPYDGPPQPIQPQAVAPPPMVPQPPPMVPPPILASPPVYYAPGYPYAQPCPLPYREVEQPRYGLIIAGSVLLGVSWSINAAVGYGTGEWRLEVPVLGPFLEAATIDTSRGHTDNRALVMLSVFDGLVETAGAAMLLTGALTHQRVRVYDRAGTQVTVVPTAIQSGGGLAAFGRF
jgi:hypothetical protein